MFLFQQPPPTQYDLRFTVAGIPVRVHPLFWLITLLFGATGNLLLLPIWILVIFVSILIHELGHAFAFRRFGQRSHIVLHFSGGLTMECLSHFLEQILQAVIDALPSVLDWLITRLGG